MLSSSNECEPPSLPYMLFGRANEGGDRRDEDLPEDQLGQVEDL